MEYVAALALRDSGVEVRDGDAFLVMWVHRLIHEDPPVLDVLRRECAADVAHAAGCAVDKVTVVEFSPEVLTDVVRRHHRLSDPGFAPQPDWMDGLWAVVGYASATIAVRERTFARGELMDTVDEWRLAALGELQTAATAAGVSHDDVTVEARISHPAPDDGSRTFTLEARRLPPKKD